MPAKNGYKNSVFLELYTNHAELQKAFVDNPKMFILVSKFTSSDNTQNYWYYMAKWPKSQRK
jgi:hypothetical protein